jgi:ABC-type multidrug transport system fused ATPase/permease subunit
VRLPEHPTPRGLLLAILRARPGLAAGAALSGAAWLAPGAVIPLMVGAAVSAGVVAGDPAGAAGWAAAIVAAGLLQTVFAFLIDVAAHGMWIHGASALQRTVVGHTARLGASLAPQAAGGEVVSVSSTDLNRVGHAGEVLGRAVGAVVAFVVVAAILLGRSPLLGAVALVGVPLAVAGLGPLIGPLQRRKDGQREELVAVNAQAADIVAGLRILRGIGGEPQFLRRFAAATVRARDAGIAVVRSESWLGGAEVLLPGVVTIAITWLGARMTLAGELDVGELVAFYAASAFLVIPVSVASEAVGVYASAMSSARRACRLLALRPLLPEAAHPTALPPGPLSVHDVTTGIRADAGALTVIDAGAGAEPLAARMARFVDDGPVLVGGVPADAVALTELRERVVLSHSQDLWFAGPLGPELVPPRPGEVSLSDAVEAAGATELVDSLPRGFDELIGERGREVSGGQRQRLVLARALATDADVLLLDEPTSAVDAHTEAAVVDRVACLRRGRTTVVFSQSALWRAAADAVHDLTASDRTSPHGGDQR